MQAVILAGGKATRLGMLAQTKPKALAEIGGRPLIDHHLRLLERYGITDAILILGHLAEPIIEELGDGSARGMKLRYYREEEPLGTAGGLRQIAAMLDDDFLLIYGDIMVDMDYSRLIRFHKASSALATLVVHPNDHPNDSDLLDVDESNRVVAFYPKPHPESRYYRNLVNAAIYVMSPRILEYVPLGASDFGKDVLPVACRAAKVMAYNSPEYIKDAGTPERLAQIRRDFESGKIASRNLERPRPAVFLDRDGVINREVGNLRSVDQFELLPGSAAAIRMLDEAGFLVLVATNQPGVAKGFCSEDTVKEIHRRLETEIGREGAYLHAIYYCPHHPDKGFPGEVESLKIDCDCRKPKTGMIDRARREFQHRHPQILVRRRFHARYRVWPAIGHANDRGQDRARLRRPCRAVETGRLQNEHLGSGGLYHREHALRSTDGNYAYAPAGQLPRWRIGPGGILHSQSRRRAQRVD